MDLISVSQLAVWEKIGHIVCRMLWALQQQQQRRKMCRNNESKKKLWCLWSPTTTIFSIRLARSIMLVFSCMLVVCAWRFRFLSPYFGTHTRQLIACHWRLDNVCFSFLGHPHGIIQRFGQDGPITLHALLEHEFIATNHNTKWLDRCNSMKWTKNNKNWNYSTANAFSMCKLQTEYYLTHSVVVIVVVVVVDCKINSKVYRVAHNLFDSNGCWQCAPETTNDQFDVVVWLFFFYYLASSREKLEWPKGDDIRVGFT